MISPGGIVNAASFTSASAPGGALAQGSLISIFGSGLGPAFPGVSVTAFPIEAVLAGVSIRVEHASGRALAALPIFVSERQINALLPSATPVGLNAVTVTYNGRTSNRETVKVVRSSFGMFTSALGAIVQNASTGRVPAPGDALVLWGTGLGPIGAPDGAGPAPGPRSDPIEVIIGGRSIPVDYHGRSGCCAGVDQVQFRLPADVPRGCAVPIQVKVQNGVFSNVGTIAISADGSPCSDPFNLPGSARRSGRILLFPDSIQATFGEAALPPAPGGCASAGLAALLGVPLDAGPSLTLNAGTTVSGDGGFYGRQSLSLGPGVHTVEGSGGAQVGPFRATVAVPAGFSWTGMSGSRSAGLTLTWTGADVVAVSGPRFGCLAPGTSVTIPPSLLINLPAQFSLSLSGVYQSRFSAPGLDAGIMRYTTSPTERNVSLGEPPFASTPVDLPGGRSILAELALFSAEQQRGLMQRTELAPDRGMLFLFDRPQVLTFWMFGTLIPLDILFLNADRRIVFISADTPPCRSQDSSGCPLYSSREPAQFVLEIAGGQAARLGLRPGDRLDW